MNKVFLGLILAVCVLGMALVMLNERLGRKQESRPAQPVAEQTATPPGRSSAEIEAAARALEIAEAAQIKDPVQETPATPEAFSPLPKAVPDAPDMPEVSPQVRQEEPVREASPPPVRQAVPEPVKVEVPKVTPPKPEPAKAEPARVEPQRAESHKAPSGSREANRFVIYARDKGATVRLGAKGKMEYSSMTLENPDRVVVDLPGDWKFPPNPGVPKNDLVSAVRVGRNGDKTRVVIDLKIKPRKVNVVPFKSGDGVDVRVDR